MKKFCSECGSKLDIGAKFCGACGQRVDGENEQLLNQSESQQTGQTVATGIEKSSVESEKNSAYQYNTVDERFLDPVGKLNKKERKSKRKLKTRKEHAKKERKRGGVKKAFRNIAVLLIVLMLVGTFLGTDESYYFVSANEERPPDIAEIIFSSPFYYYDNGMEGPKADQIKSYINDRATDSLEAADAIYDLYDDVVMEMNVFYDVANQVQGNQNIDKNLYKMMMAYESMMILSETHKANYEEATLYGYEHSYVNADTISQKLHDMTLSTAYLYQSFELLATVSANMIAGNGISNPELSKTELELLETGFLQTDVLSQLDEMVIYSSIIKENINLVNIAKLEVAKENIDSALSMAPALAENIQRMESASHPLLSDEVVGAIEQAANASAYDLIQAKIFVDQLLEESGYGGGVEYASTVEKSIIPVVYAAGDSAFDRKTNAKATLENNKEEKRGWFSNLVDTVKSAGNAALSSVNESLSPIKKVIGNGVETINAAAGAVITYGVYKYEGLSAVDTKDAIEEVFDASAKRIEEGNAGATVFSNALDYVNTGAETIGFGVGRAGEAVGYAAIAGFEAMTGELVDDETYDWVMKASQKTGSFIGGMAAGSFTGVATGSSKILNNESSDADVGMGIFEMFTSLYGASSNVSTVTGSVKDMKTAYSTLKAAAKEGAEEGFLSTLKSIGKTGVDFMKKFTSMAKDNFDDVVKKSVSQTTKVSGAGLLNAIGGNVTDALISSTVDGVLNFFDNTEVEKNTLSNEGKAGSVAGVTDLSDRVGDQESGALNQDNENTVGENPDNTVNSDEKENISSSNAHNGSSGGPTDTISSDNNTNDNISSNPSSDVNNNANSNNDSVDVSSDSGTDPSVSMTNNMIDFERFLEKLARRISDMTDDPRAMSYEEGIAGIKASYTEAFYQALADVPELELAGDIEENEVFLLFILYEAEIDLYQLRDVFDQYFGTLPSLAYSDPESYARQTYGIGITDGSSENGYDGDTSSNGYYTKSKDIPVDIIMANIGYIGGLPEGLFAPEGASENLRTYLNTYNKKITIYDFDGQRDGQLYQEAFEAFEDYLIELLHEGYFSEADLDSQFDFLDNNTEFELEKYGLD